MATRQTQTIARSMLAPAVVVLFIWMIYPLLRTIYFSFMRYNLQRPDVFGFTGFNNYYYFFLDGGFWPAIVNTLILVVGVLFITVIGGILLGMLLDQPIFGQGIVRILVISPFFVMPPVAALVWKNMILSPSYGVSADIAKFFGLSPVDWFAQYPLFSVIMIVAWQWLPFATLILLTALQSLDGEQKEAAEMDGAGHLAQIRHVVAPMSGSILGTLAILAFLNKWNEFLLPLVILRDRDLFTLGVGLIYLDGEYVKQWGQIMAAYLMAAIPLIILFLFTMRLFVRGLSHGAIKG